MTSPPTADVKRAAGVAPETARDTALGKPKYSASASTQQGSFVPRAYSAQVQLHRLYRPHDPLPPCLQRQIGMDWLRSEQR